MSIQDKWSATLLAVYLVSLRRAKRLEAFGSWACWALVQLRIGVAEFDSDVSQFFSEETDSLKRGSRLVKP